MFQTHPYSRPALAAGLTVMLLAAAGCSTPSQTQQAMDGAMYPAGYADGCESAREAGKPFSTKVVQDRNLYRDDASYATGWRQGFAACNTQAGVAAPDTQGGQFDDTTQPF